MLADNDLRKVGNARAAGVEVRYPMLTEPSTSLRIPASRNDRADVAPLHKDTTRGLLPAEVINKKWFRLPFGLWLKPAESRNGYARSDH